MSTEERSEGSPLLFTGHRIPRLPLSIGRRGSWNCPRNFHTFFLPSTLSSFSAHRQSDRNGKHLERTSELPRSASEASDVSRLQSAEKDRFSKIYTYDFIHSLSVLRKRNETNLKRGNTCRRRFQFTSLSSCVPTSPIDSSPWRSSASRCCSMG